MLGRAQETLRGSLVLLLQLKIWRSKADIGTNNTNAYVVSDPKDRDERLDW